MNNVEARLHQCDDMDQGPKFRDDSSNIQSRIVSVDERQDLSPRTSHQALQKCVENMAMDYIFSPEQWTIQKQVNARQDQTQSQRNVLSEMKLRHHFCSVETQVRKKKAAKESSRSSHQTSGTLQKKTVVLRCWRKPIGEGPKMFDS